MPQSLAAWGFFSYTYTYPAVARANLWHGCPSSYVKS